MHRADRQVGRERAGLGAGHHPLALLRHGAFRPVEQPRPRSVGADQDGVCARVLQDHRNPAVQVGDQQHPRGARADLGDPPDQAAFVQRDLALADAVVRADRQQHGLGIDAAGIGHHAGGDVGRCRIGDPVQIGLQPLVLRIQRQCDGLPAAQALILLAQPGVVGTQVPQVGRTGDGVAHIGQRFGQRDIDRRQRIGQMPSGRARPSACRPCRAASGRTPPRSAPAASASPAPGGPGWRDGSWRRQVTATGVLARRLRCNTRG